MKNKALLFFWIMACLIPIAGFSQGVAISGDNSQPDPSAMLDIKSASKGLLIPRLSTTERLAIISPADGLLVFDSTAKKFFVYHEELTSWKPLAMSEEVLWTLDTARNVAYLFINDSAQVGIGTTVPRSALDVEGTIRSTRNMIAGPDGSINYKLDENGDSIPGIFRNPLTGWEDFPPFPPQSKQIVPVKDGHDSVAWFVPNPPSGGGGGPDENFFVMYQAFSEDSLDMDLWVFLESPGFLLGLLQMPPPDGEPLWIAAITPMFENNPNGGGELYARYDRIDGSDTLIGSQPIGLATCHAWNHYRLAWKQDEYFRIWVNGTQVADLPGSNLTADLLAFGSFDNLWVDAIGLSSNGYMPFTNLGTGKSVAKLGVFDAIFARNLPGLSGYLPLSGGTLTGDLWFKPRFSSNYSGDYRYSRSELQLTSVDSLDNYRGRLAFSSETGYNESSYTGFNIMERIYAEGDLEITANNRYIGFGFDDVTYENYHNTRYRAELSSGNRGWGYGGTDRASFSLFINDTDTLSVSSSITITGFQREFHADADSIMITYNSPPENYDSWNGAQILMISGDEITHHYNISSTVQEGSNEWLIMDLWVGDQIDNLDVGDQFIVVRQRGYGLTSSSSFSSSLNDFEQSIYSTNSMNLYATGKLTLDAGINDIVLRSQNINLLDNSFYFKKDFSYGAGNLGIGTTDPTDRLTIDNGGIYLGYFYPSATTNRLYNYLGDLYWNGSPISGSGGILPSGGSGQTLRHNGTAWVASSAITNDGFLVGIGSGVSLLNSLNVGGGIYLSSSYPPSTYHSLYNTYGTLYWDGNPLIGLPTGTSGTLLFHNGGSWIPTYNLIHDGTNTGMGTISPVERLDVNGGIKVGNTFSDNAGTIRWTGSDFEGNVGSATWRSLTMPWGVTGQTMYYNGSNWTATSSIFHNAGYIGIGTTNPATELDVKGILRLSGYASGQVELLAPVSGANATFFLPGNYGTYGQVLMTNGSGTLSWTNAEVPLTFENGLTKTGSTIKLGGTLTDHSSINQGAYQFSIQNNGDYETRLYLNDDGDFNVYNHKGTFYESVFFIQDDGSVGIGTDEPVRLFHVRADKTPDNTSDYDSSFFIDAAGRVGIGDVPSFWGQITAKWTDESSNSIEPVLVLDRGIKTGDPANGFGTGIMFRADGVGSLNSVQGNIETYYEDATLGRSNMQFITRTDVNPWEMTPLTLRYNGNVGIGMSRPQENLHIMGGNDYEATLLINSHWEGYDADDGLKIYTDHSDVGFINQEYGTIEISTNSNTNQIYLATNGYVGIGTTNVHSRLTTGGPITPSTDDLYDLGSSSYRWDDVYATNGTIQTSDKRFKKNIVPIEKGLDYVLNLKPVIYEWKDKVDKKHFGLIAQDVDLLISKDVYSVVNEGDDPDKKLGINYSEVIPLLIKSVQELKAENDQLRNEIQQLRIRIDHSK